MKPLSCKENKPSFDLRGLYINPTKYCNLSCRHCWLSPPRKDALDADTSEISSEEILAVIKQAENLGLKYVKFTGGEPLLRKDLDNIFKYCFEREIDTDIETNGTLVTPRVAEMLVKYGIRHVSISLDSADENEHDAFRGKRGAFREAISGIKNLIEAGFTPQIIISLHRGNIDGFPDFIELMKSLGICDIKINTITPIGKGAEMVSDGDAPALKEILEFNKKLEEIREDFEGNIFMDLPMAFKDLKDLKFSSCGVCAVKNILGVLPDGSVSICGIGFLDEELLFGNVRKDPSVIKKIWHDHKVLKSIREDMPHKLKGVCGRCVFRATCLGACRADVFHNTGDLFAPFWLCQEAYDKGLFPKTRLIPDEAEKVNA